MFFLLSQSVTTFRFKQQYNYYINLLVSRNYNTTKHIGEKLYDILLFKCQPLKLN